MEGLSTRKTDGDSKLVMLIKMLCAVDVRNTRICYQFSNMCLMTIFSPLVIEKPLLKSDQSG